MKEKVDQQAADKECNMRAPEDPREHQKIFLITEMDHDSLRLIFKAFRLNPEMRTEMSMSQLITKIVPFTHTKCNDSIVDSNNEDMSYKYLFLNLALRSEDDIEKMQVLKCIYDL